MIEGRLRSVPALLTPAMLAARSIPVLRLCVKLRRTEKLRVGVPTPAEQRELEDFQKRITARIPVPPGATDIPDYP